MRVFVCMRVRPSLSLVRASSYHSPFPPPLVLSSSSSQVAAMNVVIMLTKKRAKDTLNMFLQFLNQVLMQYSQAPGVLENVRAKDGALFALGAMHEKMSKKKYAQPLEQLLLQQVPG